MNSLSQNDSILRPASTICSIEYNSSNQDYKNGTGAIYGIEFLEGLRHTFFITSFQLLPIRHADEIIGLTLRFNNNLGNIRPTPEWVKTLYSNSEFGITAIWFSKIAIDVLSRANQILPMLISAAPSITDKISLFGFQEGELVLRKGVIDAINGRIIEYRIIESIETYISSLGSPIFNKRNQVVGITNSCTSCTNVKRAISILNLFDEIKDNVERQILSVKHISSNEWLSIPEQSLTLIGTGEYGNVFKTKEPNGYTIALKVVSTDDEYRADKLGMEFQLVNALENHPRIIQFFALVNDTENAKRIIVMEFLEGGTLYDKIKAVKFDKIICLKYLNQILQGVAFLHKNTIYHNNIKPANILLTENDDIKICDFRFAVQSRSESIATSHLEGDSYYMSPERINVASRSAENDIWSVGATFVTMITGNTINSNDRSPFPQIKIANYELFIKNTPLKEYLIELHENDFRRKILSNTLCKLEDRVNADVLLQICKNLISGHSRQLNISTLYAKLASLSI